MLVKERFEESQKYVEVAETEEGCEDYNTFFRNFESTFYTALILWVIGSIAIMLIKFIIASQNMLLIDKMYARNTIQNNPPVYTV